MWFLTSFQKAVFKDFFSKGYGSVLIGLGLSFYFGREIAGYFSFSSLFFLSFSKNNLGPSWMMSQAISGARIPNGYGIIIVEDLLSQNADSSGLSVDIDGIPRGQKPSRKVLKRYSLFLFLLSIFFPFCLIHFQYNRWIFIKKPPVHTVKDFISLLLSPSQDHESFHRTCQVPSPPPLSQIIIIIIIIVTGQSCH